MFFLFFKIGMGEYFRLCESKRDVCSFILDLTKVFLDFGLGFQILRVGKIIYF